MPTLHGSLRYMLTAEPIPSDRALAIGLLHEVGSGATVVGVVGGSVSDRSARAVQVVEDTDALMAREASLREAILLTAPGAVASTKRMIQMVAQADAATGNLALMAAAPCR